MKYELSLKVVKKFRDEAITIFEENITGLLVFRAEGNVICVRHAGSVILDPSWDKNTDYFQKSRLKDFLGGMYIAEVKREIKAGHFKVGKLDNILHFC